MNKLEIWKPITCYEGLYEVSNLGRVRSLDRIANGKNGSKRLLKGKVLKPHNRPDNYQDVHLVGNGNNNLYSIHRLVAEAFIPNPDNLLEIDHINTIRNDNRTENLRWSSKVENMNNPLTKEKLKIVKREYLNKQIIQYCVEDDFPIAEWDSLIECSRFTKIPSYSITANLIGKTKTVCNSEFYFRYAK